MVILFYTVTEDTANRSTKRRRSVVLTPLFKICFSNQELKLVNYNFVEKTK